nr:MAG TPA: putative protease [Caudoviricetes sp.]
MGENGENAVVSGEGTQQQTEPSAAAQQQQTEPTTTNATNNTSASGTIAGNGSNGQGTQQPGTVNYDFAGVEMPEGYELSADEQGRFVDVIKGMNLSNDQARALAKYGTEYASRVVQGVEQLRAQEIAKWGDDAKTALGADLGKVQGLCDTACRKLEAMYPGLNVREALEVTGAGNQIAIVRAFAKLGELLGEDPGMAAQGGAQGLNAAQGVAANMYPKTDWSRYK